MEGTDANADWQGSDAALDEHVGVGAAAGRLQDWGEAERFQRPANHRHRVALRFDPVGLIGVANIQRYAGLGIAGCGLVEHLAELPFHPGQLVVAAAAELAVQQRPLRDDVALQAALHPPDVGGGFGVNAAQGQAGEDVGGHQQGRQAVFRLQPCVGSAAHDFGGDYVLRRGRHRDAVGRPLTVKHDARLGCQQAEIQVMHTDQPAFLVAGEGHLNGAARAVRPGGAGQRLQHDGHPGLAVAAEYGRAVGAQGVAVQHRLDAPARLHGIQVGRQQHGLPRAVQPGDDVVEGVMLHRQAQRRQPGADLPVHGVFLAAGAVNPD